MTMFALFVVRVCFAADVNVKIDARAQVKQGEEFTVSLIVNKGSIGGIGYLMQTLPAGFGSATVVEAKGSEFKYMAEGNMVKFIWISLPAGQEFTVSYKVTAAASMPNGNVTLAGKFSYVLDNQKQTFIVPDVSIIVSGETPATTTTIISQPEIPIAIGTTMTTEPVRKDSFGETTVTTAPPKVMRTETIVTTKTAKTSANTGIVFKVQIGAFKELAPVATTNKFLRIARQGFKTYKNETGLTIYTVGEFLEYEPADNFKTKLVNDGLSGAFVIAFKDGKKISATDALKMIKNK